MTRAFLIGAGATKAEYPDAPLNDDFFNILRNTNNELYTRLEEFLKDHLVGTKLSDINVEDLIERSKEFTPSIKIFLDHAIYTALFQLIAEPTESKPEQIKSYLAGLSFKQQTRFNNLLKSDKINKKDFFMTLNYDLVLDREILQLTDQINLGILPRYLIETNFNILPVQSDKKFKFLGRPITDRLEYSVYHLHGALNWEVGRNSEKIIIRDGAINPIAKKEKENCCIIPPGEKRFPPFLEQLWELVGERLVRADELIVIGCSLNPKDVKLINLLKKFVDSKGLEKVKIIYDSLGDIYNFQLNNYKKVLGGDGFKTYPHGFRIDKPDKAPTSAIEFIFE